MHVWPFLCIITCSMFHTTKAQAEKDWTIMIYMAGANDLQPYISHNIKQMTRIGSNEYITIIVRTFTKKKSETFLIEKNNIKALQEHPNDNNAGDPENLISFCCNTIKKAPAKNYALFFWDHGTGAIDPVIEKKTTTSSLFSLQAHKKNHANSFDTFIHLLKKTSFKGACFDEDTNEYLSEEKIYYALAKIQNICGQKDKKLFSIIAFDACLMAMVEVAHYIAPFTNFIIASQETEPGAGWNYTLALAPFTRGTLSAKVFGIHLVNAYQKTYTHINDYTLSLIDANILPEVEKNIAITAKTMIAIIKEEPEKELQKIIKKSRNKLFCTHFDEPSYIDLKHFYHNLLDNISKLNSEKKLNKSYQILTMNIKEGITLIDQAIITKKNGSLHKNAYGISIYFPEYIIHSAYKKTFFIQKNKSWLELLTLLLTWYY